MKTTDEILIEVYPKVITHLQGNEMFTKEQCVKAMEQYAVQFIKPTTCYVCNGTGMTDMQSQCETCKGVGMLVILPTITNTKT